MVTRVVTARSTQTALEGSKIMSKEGVGSLIITEGIKPIGIVTREDVVDKVAAKDLKASEVKLKDIMTNKLISISQDADLMLAAKLMNRYHYERLPVVSLGKVVGIISAREILKVAPAALELFKESLKIEEQESAPEESTSGECEVCGNYSEVLYNMNDQWICETCKAEGEGT